MKNFILAISIITGISSCELSEEIKDNNSTMEDHNESLQLATNVSGRSIVFYNVENLF